RRPADRQRSQGRRRLRQEEIRQGSDRRRIAAGERNEKGRCGAPFYLQVSTFGGAPITWATLVMSRQRVPSQPLPCTNRAKREKVAACSAGVGLVRAMSRANA